MELLWFILTAYGLTQILVYGKIFDKPRDYLKNKSLFFSQLIKCSMCTGFWVGVILFCLNPFTELFSFEPNFANLLICGWLSSGTSYMLSKLIGDNGININYINNYSKEVKHEHE